MAHRSSDTPADALPRHSDVDPAQSDVAKPKRRRKIRQRSEPHPDLKDWKAGAEARLKKRPIPPIVMFEPAGMDQEHIVPIHSDERAHELQLTEAFGTRSYAVICAFMNQLEALCSDKWWDEDAHQWRLDEHTFNMVLALVSAIKPRNEMEAALGAQMAAVHLLTMKVTARAIRYESDTRTAAAAGKLARTFAMQTETLQKIRGKRQTARQSIKVTKELHQHVHYHRGGEGIDSQSHAPKATTADQRAAPARLGHGRGRPAARPPFGVRLDAGCTGVPIPAHLRASATGNGSTAAIRKRLPRCAGRSRSCCVRLRMHDLEKYPTGPNGLAALCQDKIVELIAERDALPRSERKAINRHLHQVRQILAWCKTRAGYLPPA